MQRKLYLQKLRFIRLIAVHAPEVTIDLSCAVVQPVGYFDA